MSAKVLIGFCLFASVLSGCGEPANTVAVPKEEAGQLKTEPTAPTTKTGKPALNKSATAD